MIGTDTTHPYDMAGGDDHTTPDPFLFKNVPRRPRTAASWPRKEEPDGGGDPGGISVSNNASPPATTTTSVASNKRPASSTNGGAAEHVPRAKKHRLVPIEERKPKDAKDRGVGILGGMPPALSHKHKAAAAAASSASSSEVEPAFDWAEIERCRKGKTPVVNEDGACAAVARRPLAGKLLGDAIRSHGSTAVAGSCNPSSRTTKPKNPRTKTKPKKPAKKDRRTKPKKEKDRGVWFWCGTGKDGMSSAGSDVDYSFDRIGVVSDRLRTTLRGLGVAAPVRLYGRFLTRCDRDIQQTRLLMSCKRWRADGAEFPLCAFMTEEEKEAAHGEGLPLTAYDRGGDAYELTFRFLKCNVAYRLIYKWGDFIRHNGLVVAKDEPAPVDDDVMLDLWLFRQAGGKVGMVMLHYRRGDAAHADAALDELQQKRLQMMLNNGDAAAEAVMEDVVGDANEERDEDAGVMGVVAAAAPAPSSPSEPSGGGAIEAAEAASSPSEPDSVGAKADEEQAAGALGEVADAPSTTSSELHGGAGRSDEVTAPLSLGGDGTEDEEQEAGGALMVMVLEVQAAAPSSLDSNAGGAANEVAAPPSSPEAGGGATTEDDEADDELDEAGARSWNVTKYEFQAAEGLMMLSRTNINS